MKKNFFKPFCFFSLSILVSFTGILAFLPGNSNLNTFLSANLENVKYDLSPLGLDSENDPVVYTTEGGIEIKFGGSKFNSGNLSGYTYFTMGTYNATPVNWVIIGRGLGFNFESSTPAGTSLVNDRDKQDTVKARGLA